MSRLLPLLIGLLSAACLEPVRGDVPGGAVPPDDDPGKFDRPAESEEVCDDGLDNDGDGQVDEQCACQPGDTMDCYFGPAQTREVGICTSGVQTCEGGEATEFGSWGPCEDAVGPEVESCNGEDDDCDGLVDDGGACGDAPGDCWTEDDCAHDQTCVEGVCVGTGALRFTLVWDLPGDVDLHVVTPTGLEIDYRSLLGDGGTLDRDDRDGTGPENIFWESNPPGGTYLVCVVPFRIEQPVQYTLTVDNDGRIDDQQGTLEPTDDAYSAVCDEASPYLVTRVDVR